MFDAILSRTKKRIYLTVPYDPDVVASAKTIPGAMWNGKTKRWEFPVSSVLYLVLALPHLSYEPEIITLADAEVKVQTANALTNTERVERLRARLGDLSAPLPNGWTLFQHQREDILGRLTEWTHSILAWEQGLGKSIASLLIAKAYHDEFGYAVHIVAPISLHGSPWEEEASMLGLPVTLHSWAKIGDMYGDYVLIGDEIHAIQNIRSARTQAFIDSALLAKAVIGISGTPIRNGRPANLFPLLVATRHQLANNRSYYEKHFCNAHRTRFTAWDINGASNLDELHQLTQNVIIRRTKAECLDLPPKIRTLRPVSLSLEAKLTYDKRLNELCHVYLQRQQEAEKAGKMFGTSEAMVMMGFIRHAGSWAKISDTIELVNDIVDQGASVVVFASYKDVVHAIAEATNGRVLTGDTPQKERTPLKDAFQRGEYKVFCSTFGAGGVGLTLTKATYVILVDRPWTPGDALQAEDRCHRISQHDSVTVYWMQYGDVDEKVDAILIKKAKNIGTVLHGGGTTVESASPVIIHDLTERFGK